MATGQTTEPIIAELIARRVREFENVLVRTRARGKAKMLDAFRAGMRQMLTDLVALDVVTHTALRDKNTPK
jgi:hypothetical protein